MKEEVEWEDTCPIGTICFSSIAAIYYHRYRALRCCCDSTDVCAAYLAVSVKPTGCGGYKLSLFLVSLFQVFQVFQCETGETDETVKQPLYLKGFLRMYSLGLRREVKMPMI